MDTETQLALELRENKLSDASLKCPSGFWRYFNAKGCG